MMAVALNNAFAAAWIVKISMRLLFFRKKYWPVAWKSLHATGHFYSPTLSVLFWEEKS